jgi:hypothetical protein
MADWNGSLHFEFGRDLCSERSPLFAQFSNDSSDPRSLAISTTKHAHTIQAWIGTVLHVPSSAEWASRITSDLRLVPVENTAPSEDARMLALDQRRRATFGYRARILGGIGLVEDRTLILGGETTANWTGDHFRIWNQRTEGRRRGARCIGSFSATLRSCQRSGRTACLACAHQSEISFPALQ